ncbi:MAG: alginate lyase family protein, partial [Gammaproteobacteria bacterium]|nr:alginate lyase family protein [Gammaproteobacteria bacterium]
ADKDWFAGYLDWLHPNNHGVCWSMQAAAFAILVGDEEGLYWDESAGVALTLRPQSRVFASPCPPPEVPTRIQLPLRF